MQEYKDYNNRSSLDKIMNNNIKTSMKKLIPPISLYKLETNYRNLYLSLLLDQKNNNKNNNNNISIDVKEEKVK